MGMGLGYTYLPVEVVVSLLEVDEEGDTTLQSRYFFCCDWMEPTVLHGAGREGYNRQYHYSLVHNDHSHIEPIKWPSE